MLPDTDAMLAMRKIADIAKAYLEAQPSTSMFPPERPTINELAARFDQPNGDTDAMLRRAPRKAVAFPAGVELGPYKLGKGSLKNLEGVHPDLVWIVNYAIKITKQDFTVTDGIRTLWEQRENVRAGVSQTMNSKHLPQTDGWGHAVDLVPWINGKARWELLACYKIAEAIRTASQARGRIIRWGGAWTPLTWTAPLPTPEKLVQAYAARKRAQGKPAFIDGPHYEIV